MASTEYIYNIIYNVRSNSMWYLIDFAIKINHHDSSVHDYR